MVLKKKQLIRSFVCQDNAETPQVAVPRMFVFTEPVLYCSLGSLYYTRFHVFTTKNASCFLFLDNTKGVWMLKVDIHPQHFTDYTAAGYITLVVFSCVILWQPFYHFSCE